MCNTAFEKGISLREIQDWLEHSSSKTPERYAHLDSSTKIKSATAIENALSFNGNKKAPSHILRKAWYSYGANSRNRTGTVYSIAGF